MAWLLGKVLGIVAAVLSIQTDTGQSDFPPLSSHCYYVDVDIHFNASRVGSAIDLHEINEEYRTSTFAFLISQSWPTQLEESCQDVKVRFDQVDTKRSNNSEILILAATFRYEFQAGARANPQDRQLLRCINATSKKHDTYVKRFNWLSSIPSIKRKSGEEVKAQAAYYGRDIRHCCLDNTNTTCCPEGAMFVSGLEGSTCECMQGHYYDRAIPSVCHLCPKDTYQPESNMEHCEPCSEGMMAVVKGSTSCVPMIGCDTETIWTVDGTFSWKTTRVGNIAKHKCPYGPDNVTVARGCNWTSNTTASWSDFDFSSCTPSKHTEALLTLSETPIDNSNVENVTELLVMETEATTELDSYDVALATTTVIGIVDFYSSQKQVAENVIIVLDNILSVGTDVLAESQIHNKTTSRLINVTERFAENLPLQNGVYSLVASNIEIRAQAIDPKSINEDLTYVVTNKTSRNSSVATSQITVAGSAFQQAIQQGSNRLVLIVYQNNKLFPVFEGKKYPRNETKDKKRRAKIGDSVLAGKFKNAAVKMVEGAVELKFAEDRRNKRFLPLCVFWDFTANDGYGNWSSEGCFYSGTKSGHVICHCNHMTNFAILLTADSDRDESDTNHKYALSMISYIGCGVSLFAAILTFATYIFFRIDTRAAPRIINNERKIATLNELKRSNAQMILCHLCIALICLLVSYFVVATRDPKTTGCLVSSVVVHYFLLATFAWMGVEGINMYLALVKIMTAHVPRFMPKAVIIAWGFPGVVVIITGALAFDDYSTTESCFLHGLPFYISVFTPAVIVLFMNFIMFGLTMYSLSQMGKEVSQENKIQGYQRVKVALAIMVLLGLTWFFGTIAIGSARLLFQYLFCIFNSLQGFAIFWFHCVRQPEVRQCWADFLRGRRGRQRRYTASTTAPALATNAVKKSSSLASPKLSRASPKLSRAPLKLSPFDSRGKYNLEKRVKNTDQNQNSNVQLAESV